MVILYPKRRGFYGSGSKSDGRRVYARSKCWWHDATNRR
jgi:hypothetical protein